MSRAAYDAELFLVPRVLIESAIEALHAQAQEAEHWRGIRDYRIDEPLADAAALRAIVGLYEPVLSAEEEAERQAMMDAQFAAIRAELGVTDER